MDFALGTGNFSKMSKYVTYFDVSGNSWKETGGLGFIAMCHVSNSPFFKEIIIYVTPPNEKTTYIFLRGGTFI